MKKFLLSAFVLIAVAGNAQWDTLNTYTQTTTFTAIASDDTYGVVAVGYQLGTDSGDYGRVFLSGDFGDTWWPIYMLAINPRNHAFYDVDYTPSGRVWIIGDSGRVFLQTLAFFTVDAIGTLTPYSLRAGYAVDDSVYYCAGEHGVLFRTFDRGATWDTLSSGTTETLHDIYFADAANGWVVGDGGFVAITSDSGSTWSYGSVPTFGFTDFKSFAYQDTMGVNPYLVGENGTGLFSVDGGVNWSPFPTGATSTINHIRFMNQLAGVMCGDGGYITRTTDGGGTWFTDPSSETVDLYGIAFANDTTAFVCGDSGVILRSRTNISSVHGQSIPSFSMNVYPNPSNGPVYIQFVARESADVTVEVINVAGQLVETNYYENVIAGENRLELNTTSLSEGLYFIRVQSGGATVTLPLIRQ